MTNHTPPKRRVLVLGEGARAFLTVIRSLGRAGLEVHVAMCPRDDIALRSRYVAAVHDLPPWQRGDDRWVTALVALAEHAGFDLVVPCDDQSVIAVQAHRDEINQVSRAYAIGDEAFRVAFDKIASAELAVAEGLEVPRQRVVSGEEDVAALGAEFSFPLVVKPPSSFDADAPVERREVLRVRNERDLEQALGAVRRWGRGLVQENFAGIGAGVELLAKDGEVLAAFQHVRVHEPLEGGGSSYRRSAPVDEALGSASRRLISALAYTGVAMVEFRLDPVSGAWAFIEINARFWGSLPLAVAAGVDFPYYLYRMLVEGETRFPTDYRAPLYCRNLSRDLYWLADNVRADHDDPTLSTLPWRDVALEFLNVATLRERSDTFTLDDPAPGFAEAADVLGRIWRKAADSSTQAALASPPSRAVARRSVARALRERSSVGFLCYGNICRSPFAEHLARRRLGAGVAVSSAGYHPEAGRRCPTAAVEAAHTVGVDLEKHRSALADDAWIDATGLILVFDRANLEWVREHHPSARDRTHLLGRISPGPVEIEDPYGGDEARFERCYTEIARAIDALAAITGSLGGADRRDTAAGPR